MGLLELLRGEADTPQQRQLRELRDQERNKAPGSTPPLAEDDEMQREMRMKRAMDAYEKRQAAKKAAERK